MFLCSESKEDELCREEEEEEEEEEGMHIVFRAECFLITGLLRKQVLANRAYWKEMQLA